MFKNSARVILWAVTFMLGAAMPALAAELQVGVATVDITPPLGYRLSGYFVERISTAVHDPLQAKAIVFAQGEQKAALIICDVISIPLRVSTEARRRIAEQTGIPISHIAVCATHTHTAPMYFGALRDHLHELAVARDGRDRCESIDYSDLLIGKITEVARDAHSAARAVELQAGSAIPEPLLSFNRRFFLEDGTVRTNPGARKDIVRPAGPIDPQLDVLLMQDSAGKILASLTVFALHLDTTGGTEFSADYPHYLEKDLREAFGPAFVSFFGLGTCGDINHIDLSAPQRRKAAEIGSMLAKTVRSALPQLRRVDAELAVASMKVEVPLQSYPPERIAAAREQVKLIGTGKLPFLEEVEAYKIVDLQSRKGSTVFLEVQAIRLGKELAIVTLPGEVFVELGLAIKKASPFKQTVVIELANDAAAYLPTKKAFAEGGYETVNSRIQPGGGEAMVEAAGRILRDLASR